MTDTGKDEAREEDIPRRPVPPATPAPHQVPEGTGAHDVGPGAQDVGAGAHDMGADGRGAEGGAHDRAGAGSEAGAGGETGRGGDAGGRAGRERRGGAEKEKAAEKPRVSLAGRIVARSAEGRMLTGVCSGLGRFCGIDPVLIRVAFAVLVLGSGIGIILYLAAFLLMRDTDESPGYLEQWTRREFDAETVMALLCGVFAFGLIINLASGGIGPGTVVVGTTMALVLLAAHAGGVDVLALARSLPERLVGKRGTRRTPQPGPAPVYGPMAGFSQAPSAPQPRKAPQTRNAPPAPSAPPAPGAPWAGSGPQAPGTAHAPGMAGGPPAPHGPYAPPAPAGPPHGPAPRPWAGTPRPQAATGPTQQVSAAFLQPPAAPPQEPKTAEYVAPGQDAPGQDTAAQDPAVQDTPAQDAPAQDTSAQDTAERDTAERDRQERSEPGARDEPGARPYRWSAALHGSYDSSGAPYAPRGPYAPREPYPAPAAYQPLDPRRRAPYHSPYAYAPPVTAPRPRQRRPKSYIGTITVLLAIIVGGIVMAAQSASGQPVSAPVVGGAVLLTIGAGLLVATWFGRGAGLVVAGALVTLGVVASSTVTDVPRTVGSYSWSPVTVAEAMLPHRVGIGEGNLDLTDLELPPGSRVEVSGSVSVGEFTVTVPPDVRVAVRAKSRVGDVKIEHSVRGGPEVSVNTVLEPEVRPRGEVATIVLDLRAGVGDVEVRRAA